MPESSYDPRYLAGIDRFNRREYFASHEIWEDLWIAEHGPARKFYKGLIQGAVALYHLSRGNRHGASRLWVGCRGYLGPYCPQYLGLNVEDFLAQMSRCLAASTKAGNAIDASAEISFPTIRLSNSLELPQ